MQTWTLFLTLILLMAIGYYMGRSRSVKCVEGHPRALHSLPSYYGFYVALWCGLPALGMTALWLAFEPAVVEALLVASLPEESRRLDPDRLGLLINDIRNMAAGGPVNGAAGDALGEAAAYYASMRFTGGVAMVIVGICLAVGGLAYGHRRIAPSMRARNKVERVTTIFLVASSTIAVLTTVGIVLSLLFESMRFFAMVPATEFLFGAGVESADRAARRPGGQFRGLRRGPVVRRHPGHLLRRHVRGGSGGADVGDLPVGVRAPERPRRRPSPCWRSSPACRRWSTASSLP